MKKTANDSAVDNLMKLFFKDDGLMEGLLQTAPVGLVIVEESGQIVFFNEEAERMFGYSRSEVLGQMVEILLPQKYRSAHPGLRKSFLKHPARRQMGLERNLQACRKDGSEFPIEVGLSYVRNKDKVIVSAVIVDITRRKRIEHEREVLIEELQQALKNVNQLRGMLPICANCKKIRDDNGYWSQIESYIRDHSEAEFSHGICPDCKTQLYPDIS